MWSAINSLSLSLAQKWKKYDAIKEDASDSAVGILLACQLPRILSINCHSQWNNKKNLCEKLNSVNKVHGVVNERCEKREEERID